jgi:hypothetical protein
MIVFLRALCEFHIIALHRFPESLLLLCKMAQKMKSFAMLFNPLVLIALKGLGFSLHVYRYKTLKRFEFLEDFHDLNDFQYLFTNIKQ